MWNWRSSFSEPEVGGELCLWGAGVVLAAFASGLVGSVPAWAAPALVVGAVASALWALAFRRVTAFLFFGFCLSGAVGTLSGVGPGGEARAAVRFSGVIRDGFREGDNGWATRLRLEGWEAPSVPRAPRRELLLTVGGSANPETLPGPGARVAGAGELVWRGRAASLWVKSPRLLKVERPPAGLDRFRERAREKLAEAAGFSLQRQRAAALAAALVLGRREGLPEEETRTLRQAGLGHLLAVSGLHVGLVAGFFWGFFLLVGLPPATRRWLLVPVVAGFALLAGGAPPVRRAATAAVLLLLARQLGRPLELLPVFWGVVGLLVLAEPAVIWEPGFQLSAGIALALVRWVPGLRAARPKSRVWGAGAVALVAQLASAPLSGVHFGVLPPLAMLSNLLAVPLATGLVGASLAALALSWVSSPLAGVLLEAVGWGAWLLRHLAVWGSAAVWAFPPLPLGAQAGLVVLFVLALLPWRWGSVPAVGAVAGCAVAVAWATLFPPSTPQVVMLPVRQGMALWVRGREGSLLVDAGRSQREALLGLAKFRGARLDALVLTHPDADHTGGAETVLAVLRPRAVMLPELFWNRPEFLPLRWEAVRRGIAMVPLSVGQRVRVGDVACDVLWPPAEASLADNDASLVLRCQLGGVTLLSVGDLEKTGEQRVLASGQPLASDLLQVGHHGSRTSASEAFLRAVSPRLALIPTGTSPHLRFPQVSVVARLRQAGALVLPQNAGFLRVSVGEGGKLELDTDPTVHLRATRD